MKKIIYVILFILVSIGLYRHVNELTLGSEKVLHVWVSSEEYEVLKDLNPRFESMYDVDVQMKIVTSEQVLSTLPLYITSSESPDIITASHTLISDLVAMNAISPISEVFETFNILPTVKSGFKVKGEYYGIPYNAQTDILFYNKEIFEDGISSFAQLNNYTDVSLAIDYQSIYHINPFITGFGGYTVGIDNFGDTNFYDIGLNKEESIQGLTAMLHLLDKKLLYNDEFDVYQSFINHITDLMIAPASLIPSLETVYPNLGYQAIPNFVEEILPYTYMRIDTYQVTRLSQDKELAIEYLKFLLTDEVAAARYEMNRAIAPVDYENLISQDAYYTVIKKQLHRSVPLPNQVEFSYVYLPFQQAAQQFLMMPDRIQSIMDEAVGCINDELESVIQ